MFLGIGLNAVTVGSSNLPPKVTASTNYLTITILTDVNTPPVVASSADLTTLNITG